MNRQDFPAPTEGFVEVAHRGMIIGPQPLDRYRVPLPELGSPSAAALSADRPNPGSRPGTVCFGFLGGREVDNHHEPARIVVVGEKSTADVAGCAPRLGRMS